MSALDELQDDLPVLCQRPGWTATAPLPGGDFAVPELYSLGEDLWRSYSFLDQAHAERLARTYGTRARTWLAGATSAADLGRAFGATLTEAEIAYLRREEWAETAEDVLWRRTKLGLHMSEAEREAVGAHLSALAPQRP